ncbi:MAG: Gfo/Idh/MocA family oxidoreductase [Phycisphaerae bacterium]|nr:Gfo/Idh/MocA family oxidoreductase [Phycisphaerae bacterium]
MMPIRMGIIGYGRIGALHARWIERCGRARVQAVCDITPARREMARAAGFEVVSEVPALLERPLDAILVTSPTSMHFEHGLAALSADRHVMIDKPMALDFAQARCLADEAARRGRVLSVFHNRRWDRDFLTVRQALVQGVFGRVINVESRLGQWASCVGGAAVEYRPQWRTEAAFGGGGLYDWGSHFLDQIWQLLLPDRPVRVFAQLRGNVWSTDCDDFARVCIDFAGGAVALVEINTTTTRPLPRWHVDGTEGSADSPPSREFDTDTWARLRFVCKDGTERLLPMANPGLDEPAIWERFALACMGEGTPAVPIRSVLATMVLLDAARESSQTGRAVDLGPHQHLFAPE